MDIQELKNACNQKYGQAIEGMEQGKPNADIARLLLDAASDLLAIAKTDFLTRAACENKAAKLLAAAKKLRAEGDASAVYRDLTGRALRANPVPPQSRAPQSPAPQGAVKEAVMRKVLLPLKNPELYEGYVKKNGGGLLLYGPPGTGKTMIAAAIAHEIGAKFCSLGPSDLVMQGVGNSEKACVALFKEARSFPCAVLFFDEIESICPDNTHAQGARQLRSELLRQIQGMEAYGEQNDKILFLIAATNKPWEIDPAFVRPGRFGIRVYVGLPDAPARRYMLDMRLNKILQTGKVLVGNIDAAQIVEKTEGFNGADMANLLDEVQELSALRSAKTGVKEILQEDFDRALEKITSSVQEKDMQKLREWKEQNG